MSTRVLPPTLLLAVLVCRLAYGQSEETAGEVFSNVSLSVELAESRVLRPSEFGAFGIKRAILFDWNSDEYADLIMLTESGWRCFVGKENATFKQVCVIKQAHIRAYRPGVADISGDGRPDVLVDGKVWLNTPNGFAHRGKIPRGNVFLEDFDDDGDIDVVVEANEKVETLLNDGHGNLSKLHTIELDKSCVLGLVDLNQDGRIDLICSGGWETSTLHGLVRYGNGQGAYSSPEDLVVQTSRNRGVWSWKWSRYGEAGNVAKCADLNGDGRQDVVVGTGFVADGRKRDQLWMSSGSGGYIHEKLTAGGSAVYQLELGDFDLDGDIDIVSLDAATPTLRVFFNRATEPLEWNEVSIPVRIDAWMSAFDLEGDGDLDILLSGDGLALLVNTTKP